MRARPALAAAIVALVAAAPAAGTFRTPSLTFSVFVHTRQNMDSIVWTGAQFLYVQNTQNTVWAGAPGGTPVHRFASMPKLVEETRCILSPGTHGFPAGVIFCHSPDNKIYEISVTSGSTKLFATLPAPAGTVADGALTFDDVGAFGYRLVAATGRSGANEPLGGLVYTVDPSGSVHQVGTYTGPGTDNIAIAPKGFGSVAGDALLGEDGGGAPSDLIAMSPSGATTTVVKLASGLNPVVPISSVSARSGLPRAGLYLTDDETGNTFFAPASQLAAYAGDVLVASELGGHVWIVKPHGTSFRALPVDHNALHARSIEAGIFLP